jgi:hypothetical protein
MIAPRARRAPPGCPLAVLVLTGLLAASGCGDGAPTPTAPTPLPAIDLERRDTPLTLSADRYLLQLQAGDLSDDPAAPPCDTLGLPRAGKTLTTWLWFTRDGDELVGRSRPPYNSSLEMRLRRVSSSLLGVAVAGTLTGYARDEYDPLLGALDLTFNVEEPAAVEGLVSPSVGGETIPPRVGGHVRGHFSFGDSHHDFSLCTTVWYYLEVRPPGGPGDDPRVPPIIEPLGALPRGVGAAVRGVGGGAPTAAASRRGHPAETR